jgi:steroid 5-alpha reductase family enzyme
MLARFLRRAGGYAPYLAIVFTLSCSTTLASFALRNLLLQLALFVVAACIPALLTRKMAYVDAAWPWGLVLIGVQTLIHGNGYTPRVLIVSGLYLIAGLRMGVFSLQMYKPGALRQDLPRYRYQRLRWNTGGFTNEMLSIQYEVLIQALFNASLLALPAMLQAFNTEPSLSVLEITGYALWALALAMEFLADRQKQRFMQKARANNEKLRNCDVGLWACSRHPNYFFEWMVWNALILASLPSLLQLREHEPLWIWGVIGIALLYVSRFMYHTLVHYTGAVPAEYYSVQKRPDYAQYQKTTNRFFPGPRKKA